MRRTFGLGVDEFVALPPGERAHLARTRIPDLNRFLDDGSPLPERPAPRKTLDLALSLHEALAAIPEPPAEAKSLAERIVTNALLRAESDRDQNVYLGPLFTERMTRAVPDLIFQPANVAEAVCALAWARGRRVPVALRGAGTTAMGGSVPNDGGLSLDLSRLDGIDVNAAGGVCVIGAGARMRTIHRVLAEKGFALPVYPSNLGGTFAGWFATGGIGMNAFGRGRALDVVRSADLLLPDGQHLRFHDDGRLDVPDGARRKTLSGPESEGWFRSRGLEPIGLADLAGSEGVFGPLLHLTVRVEPLPQIGAFLLSFTRRDDALAAADWIARSAAARFPKPANVKAFSGSHMHHTRDVWAEEDRRPWRARPGDLSAQAMMPWRSVVGPSRLGTATSADRHGAEAYLFVDFLDLEGAKAFAAALGDCPGAPAVLDAESARVARERFRPQQTKRLGPGLLAAEIVMPAGEVGRFLGRAEKLLSNAGSELDAEVYYVGDGSALVIGGYLTDHRKGSFAVDLPLAPALLDLAIRKHRGSPYVLGRWQAAYAPARLGIAGLERRRKTKRALDPDDLVNRGVHLGQRLRGALGALLAAGFVPGIALFGAVSGSALFSPIVRLARGLLSRVPGPASGRGEPSRPAPHAPGTSPHEGPALAPTARAIHCVNCGECNTVCPIFNESKIRLPQMLTHLGEALHGGGAVSETGAALLDLCMRCGNCEEVCQAGIPHLPLYEAMQGASDAAGGKDAERHIAILAAVRGSADYLPDFLGARGGGYLRRTPVALPGLTRFLVLRAENDAGPAATCIHCSACVPVCPTHANREFEGSDPRFITTHDDRCIGCGTCVEVCPANHANGGQTLRVIEAPTDDWMAAVEEFERMESR